MPNGFAMFGDEYSTTTFPLFFFLSSLINKSPELILLTKSTRTEFLKKKF